MKTTKKLLALAALGTCLFAAAAYAAPPYDGKFSLPSEVRWGKAVLPPGEYFLTLRMLGTVPIVTVWNPKNHKSFVMPFGFGQETTEGSDTLVIVARDGQRSVGELRLASIGIAFRYEPARGVREAIREASAVETLTLVAVGK